MATYKKITDVDVAEKNDQMNVLVDDAGALKKVPASEMKGGNDWNAAEGENGHILNRTHYEEKQWVCLLPEQAVTCSGHGSSGDYVSLTADQKIDLIVGEPYTVIFDGVEYALVCEQNVAYSAPSLGSNDSYDSYFGTTINQSIPFCYAPEWNRLACKEGEHTIEIYGNKTTIKKIDEKYLPNTCATLIVSDESTVECTNMTYAEAVELLMAGKLFATVTWIVKGESGDVVRIGCMGVMFIEYIAEDNAITIVDSDGVQYNWTASGITVEQ